MGILPITTCEVFLIFTLFLTRSGRAAVFLSCHYCMVLKGSMEYLSTHFIAKGYWGLKEAQLIKKRFRQVHRGHLHHGLVNAAIEMEHPVHKFLTCQNQEKVSG